MNSKTKILSLQKTIMILVLMIILPFLSFAGVIEVGPGKTYISPQSAAQVAIPGDTILIFPSIYTGSNLVTNIHGNEGQYIYFLGVNPELVVFNGGSQGLHFSDVSYIHIEGLSFTGHTGNGMNIDDGGSFDTPTRYINVVNCHFYDMGAQGNNDFLKMSGVDDFLVSGCTFENGANGGSGIDMVGCHQGEITGCTFKSMGSNCIQAKGGTQFIDIFTNRFEDGGQRSLNLGGSTGLQFFRPLGAQFEAADINVYANIFYRGWTPIAYVGSIRVHVVNNTIINPENWVMRILQETVDVTRFLPCGDNSFVNNIVYFSNSLATYVNIGPNTDAASFEFKNNLWYNHQTPTNSSPNLPTLESNRITGLDPLFVDISSGDLALTEDSPSIDKGVLTSFLTDYNGDVVPQGATNDIGAIEYGIVSSLNSFSKKSTVNVFPNPCYTFCFIESESIEPKHLSLYDASGANISDKIKVTSVCKNIVKINMEQLRPGIYHLMTPSFYKKIVKI